MAERAHEVARLDDLPACGMRQVQAGDRQVLLVRDGEELRAFGAFCPHFGAPLADGILHGGRIVCPWHHACFDAVSGALLEPPATDDLERFTAWVEGGRVLVTLSDRLVEQRRPIAACDPGRDPRTFVIVGAGAAGSSAAQTLRAEGFRGRVVLVTAEDWLPYDRTLLSKEVLQGTALPCPFELRPGGFWRRLGIELWRGKVVRALDARSREVRFADGESLRYNAALLATGATPRRLDVPGADLPGVMALRSRSDAASLLEAAERGARAVIVGASFIAMECAASLAARGLPATVVAPEPVPFAGLFGERVGQALVDLHEDMGTTLLLGRQVARFEGRGGLAAVVTDRGERLPADIAVVGIGVAPATDMVQSVPLDEDGGVPVDASLQAAPGLFAAGDIARFPEPVSGAAVRIEHWRLACQHGQLAARNMLGQALSFTSVPFFWSAQQLALYYVGHAPGFDQVLFDGAPEEGAFIAYYANRERVTAALGVQRNAEMAAIGELLRTRRMPPPAVVRSGFDPLEALRS